MQDTSKNEEYSDVNTPMRGSSKERVDKVYAEPSISIRALTNPVSRALLELVPIPGPAAAASLLGDLAQKRQDDRLRAFLVQLAEQIEEDSEKLQEKLDIDFIHTNDFSVILETILLEASRTVDRVKLEFLQNFLLSSTLSTRPDVSWQDLFLMYVRQLSGAHLVVLQVFFRQQGSAARSDRIGGVEVPGKIPFGLRQLGLALKDCDTTLLRLACVDLVNLGLLVDWRSLRPNAVELQEQFVITDNGLYFMRFASGQWEVQVGRKDGSGRTGAR